MVLLDIELKVELERLIEEGYKKKFKEKPNKIPGIKNIVQEWWDASGEIKKNNLRKMCSEMETYSKDDREKAKEEIFKDFSNFYDKRVITNLDKEVAKTENEPKQKDEIKTYVLQDFDKTSSPKTSQPERRKDTKHNPPMKSSSLNSTSDRHRKETFKQIYSKQKATANIADQNARINIEDSKTQRKRQPSVVFTQPETIKELTPYHLKNGVVGKEFNETLDFKKIYPEGKINDFSLDGLDKIGLDFDEKIKLIHGVPKTAGDPNENYEFEITIRFEIDKRIKKSRKIFIKINPDPKSLWKVVEPAEELGDPKDHEYNKLILLDHKDKERKLFVASKRGRSHANKGTYRDDHVKIDYLKDMGWSIMAVADGCGSANLSRVGSKIACEESVKYCSNQLMDKCDYLDQLIKQINNEEQTKNGVALQSTLFEILAHAAYTAAKALQNEANYRKLKIKDFHTTLLLAIHKEFEFGHFIAGFWIGDGALAIYNEKKEVKLLGKPDGGQYSGQTVFITMKKYMETEELAKRVCYQLVPDFTALVAMSDGVSDPEFGSDKNLFDRLYWDRLWEKLQNEFRESNDKIDETLLNWLDFWAEGEHDDRSIAILC